MAALPAAALHLRKLVSSKYFIDLLGGPHGIWAWPHVVMRVAGLAAAGAACVAALVAAALLKRRRNQHEGHDGRAALVPAFGSLATNAPDEISVVSWNVLADVFSHPDRMPWVEPRLMAWDFRWPLILRQLDACRADVICLQEVDTARWGSTHKGHGRGGHAASCTLLRHAWPCIRQTSSVRPWTVEKLATR